MSERMANKTMGEHYRETDLTKCITDSVKELAYELLGCLPCWFPQITHRRLCPYTRLTLILPNTVSSSMCAHKGGKSEFCQKASENCISPALSCGPHRKHKLEF